MFFRIAIFKSLTFFLDVFSHNFNFVPGNMTGFFGCVFYSEKVVKYEIGKRHASVRTGKMTGTVQAAPSGGSFCKVGEQG